MIYSQEVENMCPVAQGVNHGCAPIPEEAKWVKAKEVKDISGLTHGVGWCAPQQGACKLTLNVKEGIIQEALVETIGCSGMTHSAAMAAEILPGRTVMEALNTDLVCDAINTAMRELFLQIVYGRSQSAFSEDGLAIGAGLEDLGKGLRSQVGTMYGTLKKGPRYLEMAEGYVTAIALDENDLIIGYKFVSLGKMTDFIKKGDDPNTAYEKACGQYGRVDDAVKLIDPRTDEEVAKAQSDPDYAKNTGIDNYTGFPIYGTGSYSEDGFPYTPTTKESVIANYNTAEKEGCEAMGFEMLTDMFAQPEEFDLLPYSALWAYQQPQELAEKQTILDEIAWPGLVKCVTGTEDEFDGNWESMVQELTDNGLADAEEAMTEFLATKLVDVE